MVTADNPVKELVNTPVPEPSVVWLPEMIGLADVDQHTPRAVTLSPPSDMTFPPVLAVVVVMELAAVVLTVAPPGMNTMSLPLDVPSLFTATSLKWIAVPIVNPVIAALTGTVEDPEPAEVVVVLVP